MKVTRRQFVKGGVAAFTMTFAAPEFLSDLARAQGAHVRNLVVLYMSGGNDSLSMLAPYNDPFYASRRPTLAANQKFKLATAVKAANASKTPEALLAFVLDALVSAPLDTSVTTELSNYLHATGAWTGSDAQLQAKTPGLVHLIAGSPEYQLA